MDLSHMAALWLAGQADGVMPGGCAVLYAPVGVGVRTGAAGQGKDGSAAKAWTYPFSAERWVLGGEAVMRAGMGLIGELEYGPDGLAGFVPRLFSAVNLPGIGAGFEPGGEVDVVDEVGDPHLRGAQVRLAGAAAGMIGGQVSRGMGSIGLSDRLAFVDRFDAQGVLGRARVVGFVERGGQVAQSCADVALGSFPVMYEALVDYLRFAVSAQVAGNGYDDLAGVLARSDRPTHAVVVVGLSGVDDPHLRGAQGRLAPGDVCHSVVYDGAAASLAQIAQALGAGETDGVLTAEGVSWLRQVVE